MNSQRNITGYKTSRNYERLIKVARIQSVVCIVDYNGKGIRDVAHTIWPNTNHEAPDVSVRGHGYIDGDTKNGFIAQCQLLNLEWLESNIPFEKSVKRLGYLTQIRRLQAEKKELEAVLISERMLRQRAYKWYMNRLNSRFLWMLDAMWIGFKERK